MKRTIYIVQVAEYFESSGELIPFAKAFTTLEQAAKFVVKDYNAFCREQDDPNTLSNDAWKGLSQTLGIESPSEWSGWIKWEIKKQTLNFN